MNSDLSGARWFKSSYSTSSGGDCVEAAHLGGGQVAVRDSTLRDASPVLVFEPAAWDSFTAAARAGVFDLI
ncbi:DUF397 domain-containing protein [Nocardia sp. CDC160]|uniref:DUF397 domain-containing protein n=1 Tax=Nocardia sp. CDC160 TaxID=3112166 RepID=UPI002DBC96D5|nr:DUF397 domain-containing protein [Nocardia sp. CDC160]MEC3918844.1 DUF397 domain-containing protein [Nocardia sp. CDC160]